MLSEIYENIYLNEITLPNSPLKYLNSYIIKDGERPLVIDTGFNRPECRECFLAGLEELSIDIGQTDVLITHLHSDHCGLIHELQERGARIMMGELESPSIVALNDPRYWDKMAKLAHVYDLEKYGLEIGDHPGYRFRPGDINDYRTLSAGETLKKGGYNFQVLLTPGHTLGHIALYEAGHGLLFCGDLILEKITPTITFWGFEHDILQVYFDTLDKIRRLPVKFLLTGHRALLKDHGRRIGQLMAHHEKRLAEIKDILQGGEKSVAATAGRMTWEIKAKSWEDFPKAQKWFAAGEAMAHLEHLCRRGQIERRDENGILLYKASRRTE
ncbi:MAG: MBL fold metallo-hydrolase [Acidaminococcales bacterium]|jgi:glyoxylase-like metal-dependent hydrolase (beta-lactamase superfamily II)|nr:MBL fold metallo-hydrolase [Acidaminococcales bacterium]